ncbi:hypothetical protein WA1_48520 [Scytonema hofmannii PCC 7110]|uniref:Bacteriocin n=1 Tax=Scytonema hofmannii PCC 7110 TaxID=128403 RepID=A0A139WTX4_9CYAN|nr:Blp family class II bacteriocin [Scytonema hofmannii]KYC35870.1 hypothetical protein WA1_48520 [Scytonema hofmannii PCC 7110]
MAIIKITELQSVNQVEELSNEDLTSVVGGLVGGLLGPTEPGAAGGGPFDIIPIVGPLLSGLLGGFLGGPAV